MSKDITYWRYELPSIDGEGWGIFILDSTGCFSCVTDYGNYAFKWTHHGMDDFRKFFDRNSYDYILSKLHLGAGKSKELDIEATAENIKNYILNCRRDETFDEDSARSEWDHIINCEEQYDHPQAFFMAWYEGTEIDDAYEFSIHDYCSDDKALRDILLPRLTEAIQKELAQKEAC